jgi:hypothetical protein
MDTLNIYEREKVIYIHDDSGEIWGRNVKFFNKYYSLSNKIKTLKKLMNDHR